jgi:Replication initiator protein A
MQDLLLFPPPQPPVRRIVRVEKNLNSLGFFSPTASTGKRKQEKIITFTRDLQNGVKTEAKATILATSRGLPNTADLDKYLAFQLIVADLKKKHGVVGNPIGFTTYQLLRLLGLKPTGKRYAEVDQWLDRMAGTLIKSEGAVYFAKNKRYMKDRFHVFEKVYTVGEELPDGKKAEQNYVFLSDWQLENLNHGHVLPISLEHYQQLRSDIAKNLVPLLYIWFYASRGPFQKRYRDLCQHLNIKIWAQFSRAKEQFSPGLAELKEIGYLAAWELCPTIDRLDFKLVLTAGPIFTEETKHTDVRQRDDTPQIDSRFTELVTALTTRGVHEKVARRLLFALPEDADVERQVEWIDSLIQNNRRKFHNPAGVYVNFIRDGIAPPLTFISSHRRKEVEVGQHERRITESVAATKQLEIENRYTEYREKQANTYIASLSSAAKGTLLKDARNRASKSVGHFEVLTREQQNDLINRFAINTVLNEIQILSKQEFQNQDHFQQLSLLS